ncbi:hypothetical protein [Roseisolibacter agri]|uniref:hypothetical protein n=1 Tax=Roseisolibacter agri TaxID=2014610 RepID=UPI0024E115CC|nr:hypothetical protein [Roseisolibacter agri]
MPLPSVAPFELVQSLPEVVERRGVLARADRALVEGALQGVASLDVPVTALDTVTAFFGAWRREKRVYRLTPELAAELRDVPWPGAYPCAHFRLPDAGVVLEVPADPARGEPARTLTAHVDLSVLESPTVATRLAVLVHELEMSADMLRLRPLAIIELGGGTLGDAVGAIRHAVAETHAARGAPDHSHLPARERAVLDATDAWDETSPAARLAVNTLLYVLGEPDVVRTVADARAQGPRLVRHLRAAPPPACDQRPEARRAADLAEPDVYLVGTRYAAAVRRHGIAAAAREHGTAMGGRPGPASPPGRTVRPHLRAAHWHLYWVGPGRTTPALRFIPTTVVHGEETARREAVAPVVRLVG